MIDFAHPEWLVLLLTLPILAFFRGKRGGSPSVQYSSIAVLKKVVTRTSRARGGAWRTALRLFSLFCLIVALAGPRFDRSTTEAEASGIDIVMGIDVSSSMESLDFERNGHRVNRIEVLKPIVNKFIEERPNDRIGLVAFARQAYLLSPITLDRGWLQQNIERLRTGLIEDGTAIGSGITTGLNRLRASDAKSKVLILLTDGVNNSGRITPTAAAEAAKALGIKIYTIGVGIRGEAPYPMQTPLGQRLIMVKTEIDEDSLRKVASTTGGQYFRATDTASLENIYRSIDRMEKTTRKLKKFENYEPLFAWALLPGILLLGTEVGLAHTRFRKLP